jgi:hypothetical protein
VLSLVPVAVLGLGVLQLLRTRRRRGWGKVKTACLFTPNIRREGTVIVHTGPASLLVEAVNHGPGEVTIRALRGRYKDGKLCDIDLRTTDRKLKQGDRIARAIMPLDQTGGLYDGLYNEEGSELVDMWFEDTFGRAHKLKRVQKYLREIRGLV